MALVDSIYRFCKSARYRLRGIVIAAVAASLLIQPALISAAGSTPGSWAQREVREAYSNGLVPYELMGSFQKPITRKELSAVVVRLYGKLSGQPAAEAAGNPFKDTKDENVLKAYSLGLIGGTGADVFSPDQPVTREQLAVILYLTFQRASLSAELETGHAAAFADEDTIAAWAKAAAGKLAAAGILQGTDTKAGLLFRPKSNVTREEIYVLADRIAVRYTPLFINNIEDLLSAVRQNGRLMVFKDSKTKQTYDEAVRVVGEIMKPEMDDMEKELAIHDYIVLHTAYDYDHFQNNTIPGDSYNAYGVLLKGTAVCQGYAEAAQLMLTLAGIDSQIVTGYAGGGGHAWNKVKIDGEYYNLDTTWDDPAPDEQGRVIYSYFNVTDEELAKDHEWNAGQWPAAAGTAYNYFEYKGLVIHSSEELKDRITKMISSRETEFSFKPVYAGKVQEDMHTAILPYQTVLSGYSFSFDDISYTLKLQYR